MAFKPGVCRVGIIAWWAVILHHSRPGKFALAAIIASTFCKAGSLCDNASQNNRYVGNAWTPADTRSPSGDTWWLMFFIQTLRDFKHFIPQNTLQRLEGRLLEVSRIKRQRRQGFSFRFIHCTHRRPCLPARLLYGLSGLEREYNDVHHHNTASRVASEPEKNDPDAQRAVTRQKGLETKCVISLSAAGQSGPVSASGHVRPTISHQTPVPGLWG